LSTVVVDIRSVTFGSQGHVINKHSCSRCLILVGLIIEEQISKTQSVQSIDQNWTE